MYLQVAQCLYTPPSQVLRHSLGYCAWANTTTYTTKKPLHLFSFRKCFPLASMQHNSTEVLSLTFSFSISWMENITSLCLVHALPNLLRQCCFCQYPDPRTSHTTFGTSWCDNGPLVHPAPKNPYKPIAHSPIHLPNPINSPPQNIFQPPKLPHLLLANSQSPLKIFNQLIPLHS